MNKPCPVCRAGTINRREVKTCGAPDCVAIWRTMTASERIRAVEGGDISTVPNDLSDATVVIKALDDLKKGGKPHETE